MNLEIYTEDRKLLKDEFLLKVYQETWNRGLKHQENNLVGFMTKLTQKKEIPKSFLEWKRVNNYAPYDKIHGSKIIGYEDLPIYVIKEEFRSGWIITNFRPGMSQNWAVVKHPMGFHLEIYLEKLVDIIAENSIINGEIIGEFKWEDKTLIKKL